MKRYIYIMISAIWLTLMSGCAEHEPEVLGSLEGYSVEVTSVTSTTATIRITLPESAVEIMQSIVLVDGYKDYYYYYLRDCYVYDGSGEEGIIPDGSYYIYDNMHAYSILTEGGKKLLIFL